MKNDIHLVVLMFAICLGFCSSRLAYNPDIALKAVYYSAATYCNKTIISSWTCGPPCETQQGVEAVTKIENADRDTFGFVTYNAADN